MIASSNDTTTPSSLADWEDVASLQKRMVETLQVMSALTNQVGIAKHVIEYDSDMRKKALSRAMAPSLVGGASASKAEAEARASDIYSKEMTVLAKRHEAALTTVEEYSVLKIQWETCRSLLSMQKEALKL